MGVGSLAFDLCTWTGDPLLWRSVCRVGQCNREKMSFAPDFSMSPPKSYSYFLWAVFVKKGPLNIPFVHWRCHERKNLYVFLCQRSLLVFSPGRSIAWLSREEVSGEPLTTVSSSLHFCSNISASDIYWIMHESCMKLLLIKWMQRIH